MNNLKAFVFGVIAVAVVALGLSFVARDADASEPVMPDKASWSVMRDNDQFYTLALNARRYTKATIVIACEKSNRNIHFGLLLTGQASSFKKGGLVDVDIDPADALFHNVSWRADEFQDGSALILASIENAGSLAGWITNTHWFDVYVNGDMYDFNPRPSESLWGAVMNNCHYDISSTQSVSASSPTKFGDTPLHLAVRENDLASARQIITTSTKSVLCARNDLGQVPAQLADILGRNEIWSMLYAMNATKHQCER